MPADARLDRLANKHLHGSSGSRQAPAGVCSASFWRCLWDIWHAGIRLPKPLLSAEGESLRPWGGTVVPPAGRFPLLNAAHQ